jgi:exodeoxyribonuclease VII large subunit
VVRARIEQSQGWLDGARQRPVLADPGVLVSVRAEEVRTLVDRARRGLDHRLVRAADDVEHVRARVRALSPAATLERGYAVVQTDDGDVVRLADDVATGARLRIRLAQGELHARRED